MWRYSTPPRYAIRDEARADVGNETQAVSGYFRLVGALGVSTSLIDTVAQRLWLLLGRRPKVSGLFYGFLVSHEE